MLKSHGSMSKLFLYLRLQIFSLLFVNAYSITTARMLQNGFDLTSCPPVEETPPSQYNIQLINMGNTGSRYDNAFREAASRWEKIIVGDLEDVTGDDVDDWFIGLFSKKYTGPVDDVVIGYEVSPGAVDGLEGRIGIAGNVHTRKNSNGVTTSAISGIMKFDSEDFDRLPETDLIPVIIHEMGHVLGLVGTIGDCANGCSSNQNFMPYKCELANTEYKALTGKSDLTACGHWDSEGFSTEFSSEMMTGIFTEGIYNPISLVSVAALADVGYEVDYCGADHWPAEDPNAVKRHKVYATGKTPDMVDVMTKRPTSTPTAKPTKAPSPAPVTKSPTSTPSAAPITPQPSWAPAAVDAVQVTAAPVPVVSMTAAPVPAVPVTAAPAVADGADETSTSTTTVSSATTSATQTVSNENSEEQNAEEPGLTAEDEENQDLEQSQATGEPVATEDDQNDSSSDQVGDSMSNGDPTEDASEPDNIDKGISSDSRMAFESRHMTVIAVLTPILFTLVGHY